MRSRWWSRGLCGDRRGLGGGRRGLGDGRADYVVIGVD